jgi:hypothetical protein
LISLGRGFYKFKFSSDDDMCITLAMGTVNLKVGLLRLSRWSKDFNKYFQRLTHAHGWIRLLDLPQEYWLDRTLMEIAAAIGTPLIIDVATHKRTFGYYVRVLVDIGFFRRLFYEIMVEREGCEFPVEVEYEWLPEFCTHCQILGHSVTNCRWLHLEKDPTKDCEKSHKVHDKGKQLTIQQKPQKQIWKARDNVTGIGSSLAFEQSVTDAPTSEITTPSAAPEQTEHHVSPTVSGPVDTHLANPENGTNEMANTNDHLALENGDKSASYYHLALQNVTDEIARTNALTQTTWLESVLQLQNVIDSIETLLHEEGIV